MAERRMFSKKITDDDNFQALSSSAQALYLHLNMASDDDGFCNQVSLAMFKAHASVQDLEALINKAYVLQFESGVVVIKHWLIHNTIQRDRYHETAFLEEKSMLGTKENKAYTMLPDTGCIQDVYRMETEVRLGKDRLGKSKEKENKEKKEKVPPSLEEVAAYCTERNNGIDPEAFIDFYQSKNWKVGKDKMTDWKAAVRTWERRRKGDQNGSDRVSDKPKTKKYDIVYDA